MKDKRRFRAIEWAKSLLMILLALSLVYLLGRTYFLDKAREALDTLLSREPDESIGVTYEQGSAGKNEPLRLAVYHNGLRYGVQYDQDTVDADHGALSILFAEALSSAGEPVRVPEQVWQTALCSTGIYMDYYYPIPMEVLAGWLGGDAGNTALSGSARRICLAENAAGGVSLYYVDEASGRCYESETTLSLEIHLDAAVLDWAPNGAQFAFEVEGMERLDPYTLLTATPEPAICAVSNPLLDDENRVEELASKLTFHVQSDLLDPAVGGQLMEGNDTLRLSKDGTVTFHTMGDSEFRFALPEERSDALDYVQALAQATAGAWCGRATLCLAEINESAQQTEIVFQYCLNGIPVKLSEDQAAARFVVKNGAVTDFSLYLRCYTDTGETSLVLPTAQAAAAMAAMNVRGKELMLLYEDTGAELAEANWIAN